MHKSVEEEVAQFIADISLYHNKNAAVLVEDREDIPFWERILQHFAPGLKPVFPFISASGKDTLRKYADHVSSKVLICVDSDNDAYHITPNTTWLHPPRPFIYQTYAHSRENHYIHPANLELDIRELLQAGVEHDFRQDFSDLSEALYPWLVLWLFFTDQERQWLNHQIEGWNKEVSWNKLKDIIKECMKQQQFSQTETIEDMRNLAVYLRESISLHREELLKLVSENGYGYLEEELEDFQRSCPISPEEALWFIQGHCALEDVVLPYFAKTVQVLSRELATKAQSQEERNRWQNQTSKPDSFYRYPLTISYRNCLIDTTKCRFFDLIKSDIARDFPQ